MTSRNQGLMSHGDGAAQPPLLFDGRPHIEDHGRPEPTETTGLVPLAVTVAEAAALLRVSDDVVYELVRRGELPGLRIGRRRVIPLRALELLIEEALAGFDPSQLTRRLYCASRTEGRTTTGCQSTGEVSLSDEWSSSSEQK
jgi:excisionase family DNA binding protein